MTKRCPAAVLAVCLTLLAGCGGSPERPPMAGNPAPPPSSSQAAPAGGSGGDALAPEDAAGCRERYLLPLLHTGLLYRSFGPGQTEELAESPLLIYAFEDLSGPERMARYSADYGPDLPGELVEGLLTARFPVTPEELRETLLSGLYDPERRVYHYEGGRGGAPMEVELTDARREGEDLLLDYTLLALASMEDDEMRPVRTGTLTLREAGEDWQVLRCQSAPAA